MHYVLITKKDEWSKAAGEIAQCAFGDKLQIIRATCGRPLEEITPWAGPTTLISFLCPWVIPAAALRQYVAAINFHPGSTDYPGIGCYNFALFDGAKTYGATCHHMAPLVDSGGVVQERRFFVLPNETVHSLKTRTMAVMLAMFSDVISLLAFGDTLPKATSGWSRKPYTRKQLNELGRITPAMRGDEISRRIRAMHFPGYPGAFVELNGARFYAEA